MNLTRRLALALIVAAPAGLSSRARAQTNESVAIAVRRILAGEPDYLQTKLAIDALVDPSINSTATSQTIARMTGSARELAGPDADNARKLASVRTVIYQAGAWNDNRPFSYDQADPYGRNIRNKLLATYLNTRRGNCVSMPILFLILANALGVNVALAAAPLHVFVRYTDAGGRAVNLEATSGAHPARDVWYRENLPMSDAAVANGIYMRTLSRRESVALMATTVAEFLYGAGRYEEAIAVAGVILENSPRDAQTMVLQASAYGRLLSQEFEQRYASPTQIPPSLHSRYNLLGQMNESLFARAEGLGWTPSEQ